jgi:hypothetical protein
MKDLSEITNKQALELGNMAFRVHEKNHPMGGPPYYSKKWKLHLFQGKSGHTERIAIVDEKSLLLHIDHLWSESPVERHSHDNWQPTPQYNWIEISRQLVIKHYRTPSITLILNIECQYFIFVWLEQNGFMGDKAIENS